MLLCALLVGAYWYVKQQIVETQDEPTAVVISEPVPELKVEHTLPVIDAEPFMQSVELSEQLDALILPPSKRP